MQFFTSKSELTFRLNKFLLNQNCVGYVFEFDYDKGRREYYSAVHYPDGRIAAGNLRFVRDHNNELLAEFRYDDTGS